MKQRWLHKQLEAGLHFLKRQTEKGVLENELQTDLLALDQLLEQKKYEEAFPYAERIAARLKQSNKRSFLSKALEFAVSLVAAILVAGVIRQCWFELYEIPTGSMTTFPKEKDRVLVSKTPFGLNIPFTPGHLLFSPDRIKRGSIVVVTAEGLDVPDVDTMYFGIFPGEKKICETMRSTSWRLGLFLWRRPVLPKR